MPIFDNAASDITMKTKQVFTEFTLLIYWFKQKDLLEYPLPTNNENMVTQQLSLL
jgi:hypothetical protein